jgi:hypothetical protein
MFPGFCQAFGNIAIGETMFPGFCQALDKIAMGEQCFLACQLSGNMARKQRFLVFLALIGNNFPAVMFSSLPWV